MRLIGDDLKDGWADARARRALVDERFEDLCPMAELAHPLIAKACEWFGTNAQGDNYHQAIRCATSLGLLEVQAGQWRGAVWTDPATGVRWLVAGGLAKGNHEDSDDFWVRLEAIFTSGREHTLLPTDEDRRLLAIETGNALIFAWEMSLQAAVTEALTTITTGGSHRIEVRHPTKDLLLAAIDVEMAIEPGDGYAVEAFVVTFGIEPQYRGSDLAWTMALRVLACVSPPEQEWDRFGDTMSVMTEVGHAAAQASVLSQCTSNGELCPSVPGNVSHWAHRRNLADSAVDGFAVRAMCGRYFVPFQDPIHLTVCPECDEIRDLMPE